MVARLQLDSLLVGKVDPSDMAQQALLRAHRASSEFEFRGQAEELAWLRRILRNCIADEIRRYTRGKRRADLEVSLQTSLDESSTRLDAWLGGNDPTPSEVASQEEELARMADALEDLPEDQRRVIELHHLKGKSVREIADELQKTRPSVAGLLRRGIATLNAELAPGQVE